MKRAILNPFGTKIDERGICFGCSEHNPIGLRMSFFEENGMVCSEWVPDKKFEGYNGVIHGGIQATMMDEIASWYIYTQLNTAGVTKSLSTHYHEPCRISSEPILIRAVSHKKQNRRDVAIETEILCGNQLCTSGTIVYVLFPEEMAKTKFNYPGIDAFFAK
ncbi:PaaI family thioesterase [Natronoflexus pectinivorans]|uniref:Acyl-coenzyme A thioesterase PaaI-like protein n=1 Tax=Natronoflexus pectinivorans TaxID=682526 RepID=A0A4R2GL57_9BACT|nr:PaaI family thioesterase [Natronoflexus pectinivorans]TCO09307.1 acyl-coenzyme A thioesterase PaaI-like protein [Natronoflexus pectinivorans]